MKCENCGTENNFEWATFCMNCQQPLPAETDNVAAQHAQKDNASEVDNSGIQRDGPAIEESDKLEIGSSDPMDYIMGSKSSDPASIIGDSQDSIKPEPIENELTLYRDNDLKVSLSQDTASITVESVNDGIKISAEEPSIKEKTASIKIINQQSGIDDISPAVDSNSVDGNPPETSAEYPTQAVQVVKVLLPEEEQITTNSLISGHSGAEPVLNELKQSRGVIYLSGRDLKLTGGLKVVPGDQVIIRDRAFEVKNQPGHGRLFYIGITAIAAVVILSCLVIFTTSSKEVGQLIGTVSNIDGRPLVGQGVRIAEMNKSVSTNEAGFFIFNDIPAGIYTLDIQAPSGGKIQDRISVVKGQTTTIALSDHPVEPVPAPVQTVTQTQKVDNRSENIAHSESKANAKGILRLTLSPSNASAFVNDRPLGVGSNSYKIEPGNYSLTIRKEGYEEFRQQIRIDPDNALTLRVELNEAPQTKLKSNSEMAQELEAAGRYGEAQQYYDRALKSDPRNVNAMLGKARCARSDGRVDNAMTYYMQAARMASDKGDANSQILALSGVIDMRPNTYTAYSSRGEILYNLGQYDKAAGDFEQVVQFDKRNLGAYYKLGDCFYKAKRYPDAISAFAAAQELNFADPKAGVWLTKTYIAMGDKKNAKKAYESFKEIASYSTRLEYKRDPEWKKILTALGEKE